LLPKYASRDLISQRLPLIFPEGTPNRNYCIRELAASTIFSMLYIGAVEGEDVYLGPIHVYRMTKEQASSSSDEARIFYRDNIRKKGFKPQGERWYADNTREPIRDETLREGLIVVGAVVERQDVATTSSLPRYALKADLAALFDPSLGEDEFMQKVAEWQQSNLSQSALARVSILRAGTTGKDGVLVTFPNGETRHLAHGPSSKISKAVVEEFAKRFLEVPGVIWLSESGNKVAMQDEKLAAMIGLEIQSEKNLPDLILVDLGPPEPLLVFVEVVATDGAITPRRRDALFKITDRAGFARKQVSFVTAYKDRESAGFKKTVTGVSWGSFAWFMSEPDHIVLLKNGVESLSSLAELVDNEGC
jgi:hypothetical protein